MELITRRSELTGGTMSYYIHRSTSYMYYCVIPSRYGLSVLESAIQLGWLPKYSNVRERSSFVLLMYERNRRAVDYVKGLGPDIYFRSNYFAPALTTNALTDICFD